MRTLIEIRKPRTECGKGALLFALAYAPETRCWFLWLGGRLFSDAPRLTRDAPRAMVGKAGW